MKEEQKKHSKDIPEKNTEETVQEQNANNPMDEQKHLDGNQATNQDLRPVEERRADFKKNKK